MSRATINHYATLGLDRDCAASQIRAAYRLLAKHHHPDLNPNSTIAVARTQALNIAYETLNDPERRAAYDRQLESAEKSDTPKRSAKIQRNISQDVSLRLEDFLRGAKREVRVNDPANSDGAENYVLVVPPNTAPGTRFRLPRVGLFGGGYIQLRLRALPGFRFKVRGSDLRCDLKISSKRAAQAGTEMMQGISGAIVRVQIPRGIGRNEIIRIPGEGLPKARGGRGDLLVRIIYRVEVRVARR